jgi:YHS domain-containing protein
LTPHFEWNYTTFLNFIFIGVAVAVWWMAKNKARFGGGLGYAIDPVCGMQIRIADAPASSVVGGKTIHFCADRCKDRFDADPDKYAKGAVKPQVA